MGSVTFSKKIQYRGPPRGFGEQGKRVFISGEQGNKGQILRGTGEQRQYWGTENIRKTFDFGGEQGNKPIYFRRTREQVPPPPLGGPQYHYENMSMQYTAIFHGSKNEKF